jgi:hypothetical protein
MVGIITNDGLATVVDDAGRQKMKIILFLLNHDCVSSIVSPLEKLKRACQNLNDS